MTERDWAESDYVRVYQSVRGDPKFAVIYPDDRAFAAYVRLLMDADAMYPVRPNLPASLAKYAREVLVKAGVLAITGTTYSVSGLGKEREARYGKGKGRPRYPSDTGAKSEPSRSETGAESESSRNLSESPAGGRASGSVLVSASSSPEGGPGETDPLDEVRHWLGQRRAWVNPGSKVETELARIVDRKGAAAVIGAMGALDGAEDGAQFVFGARNALFPLPGSQTAKPVTPAERDAANARQSIAAARAAREGMPS